MSKNAVCGRRNELDTQFERLDNGGKNLPNLPDKER